MKTFFIELMLLLSVLLLADLPNPRDYCSGSGQGRIDCPREYRRPLQKKKEPKPHARPPTENT